MAPKGCPETSVRYQHTLPNNPEERRPRVLLVLRVPSWSVHSAVKRRVNLCTQLMHGTRNISKWQHSYQLQLAYEDRCN